MAERSSAQNIVDYRTENGPFSSRKELLKVPRMGAKAFEQCAGFLRIPQAKNPQCFEPRHDVYKRQVYGEPLDEVA